MLQINYHCSALKAEADCFHVIRTWQISQGYLLKENTQSGSGCKCVYHHFQTSNPFSPGFSFLRLSHIKHHHPPPTCSWWIQWGGDPLLYSHIDIIPGGQVDEVCRKYGASQSDICVHTCTSSGEDTEGLRSACLKAALVSSLSLAPSLCAPLLTAQVHSCGEPVFVMLKLQQHAVESARCIKAQYWARGKTDTVSDIAGSFGFASSASFLSLNNHWHAGWRKIHFPLRS